MKPIGFTNEFPPDCHAIFVRKLRARISHDIFAILVSNAVVVIKITSTAGVTATAAAANIGLEHFSNLLI